MRKTYSWAESQQIIEFYEEIVELVKEGWSIGYDGKTFLISGPAGELFLGDTLEITLLEVKRGHIS